MITSAPRFKKGLVMVLLLAFVGLIVACAPQAPSEESPQASGDEGSGTDAMNIEWSPDADCTICHSDQAASRENTATVASLHATSNCIDCHTATDALVDKHEGVTSEDRAPKRLTKTSVSEDYCLTCHESYESLAEKTVGYQELMDEEGTVVNPHDLPSTVSHDDVTCTNCHSIHATDAPPSEKSMSTCVGCHHEHVFACGTCHN